MRMLQTLCTLIRQSVTSCFARRFTLLKAVNKDRVWWGGYRRFGRNDKFSGHGLLTTTLFVNFCHITRRRIPQDSNLQWTRVFWLTTPHTHTRARAFVSHPAIIYNMIFQVLTAVLMKSEEVSRDTLGYYANGSKFLADI